MKTVLGLITFFVLSFYSTEAQPLMMADNEVKKDRILFDSQMNLVYTDADAEYVGYIEPEIDGLHLVKVYRSNNKVKYEGTYLDPNCKIEHGQFTFYYYDGQIESTGEYKNGIKVGEWKRFDPQGNEMSSKFYTDERYKILADLKE